MTDSVEFGVNLASAEEIADHLARCDNDFAPRLSERVRLPEYARKIGRCATRFEAWEGGRLVGLLAAYCNDTERRKSFVTSVSVEKVFQRTGLATRLMSTYVAFLQGEGFQRVELEADSDDMGALGLYAKFGFVVDGVSQRTVAMHLNIAESRSHGQSA